MDNPRLLITAMAVKCRETILDHPQAHEDLPAQLHPRQLKWMCDQIEEYAEVWPATKLHRWLGFVQCAMLANGMVDFDGLKEMFDAAKVAHGELTEEFLDHLDPTSSFEIDIGGEG